MGRRLDVLQPTPGGTQGAPRTPHMMRGSHQARRPLCACGCVHAFPSCRACAACLASQWRSCHLLVLAAGCCALALRARWTLGCASTGFATSTCSLLMWGTRCSQILVCICCAMHERSNPHHSAAEHVAQAWQRVERACSRTRRVQGLLQAHATPHALVAAQKVDLEHSQCGCDKFHFLHDHRPRWCFSALCAPLGSSATWI